MNPKFSDEDTRFRAGRRVSMSEAAAWMTGLSIALATPYWLGSSSLLIFYYGTLIVLTWRLSKAMPFILAVVVALVAAVVVTSIMIAVINR